MYYFMDLKKLGIFLFLGVVEFRRLSDVWLFFFFLVFSFECLFFFECWFYCYFCFSGGDRVV